MLNLRLPSFAAEITMADSHPNLGGSLPPGAWAGLSNQLTESCQVPAQTASLGQSRVLGVTLK